MSDAIAAILSSEPDWTALPGTTPSAIRRLMQRSLEKDPKQRLRDIGDVRIELASNLDPDAMATNVQRSFNWTPKSMLRGGRAHRDRDRGVGRSCGMASPGLIDATGQRERFGCRFHHLPAERSQATFERIFCRQMDRNWRLSRPSLPVRVASGCGRCLPLMRVRWQARKERPLSSGLRRLLAFLREAS